MVISFIASTLSMLATLAIAYGIDRWVTYQQRIARRDLSIAQAEIWVIVGGLVLLLVWLALGWFILAKRRRMVAVSVVYILVGLLAFLWFPLELVSVFWSRYLFLFPNLVYNLQYTGLFIAALGILTLVFPNRDANRAKQPG